MDNLKPHRFAIIDFGSNTVRLVVMSAIPGYSYRLEDEIREVVRLRQGMTEEGLSDEAMARAFSTLRLFKRFCDSTGVDTVLATATSAVREAANGEEFVERIEREIGLKLQILEGESEAYYGVLGALNEMPLSAGAVLDIGGGSAQVSQVEHDCAAYKTLFKGGDEKLLICLAAILRLAEFMERGRNAAVDDVSVTWTDAQLRLTLIADEYPAVELWETERHAVPLVEEAFKRRVIIDSLAPPGELSEQPKEEDDEE